MQDFAVKLPGCCRKMQAMLPILCIFCLGLTHCLPQPAPSTATRLLHPSLVLNGPSTPAFLSLLFLIFSCPSTYKTSCQNPGIAQVAEGKWHGTAHRVNSPPKRMTSSKSRYCLWSMLLSMPRTGMYRLNPCQAAH